MSTYKDVPLGDLVESKTNPRTEYDGAALLELAESIKELGVAQPLVVRPKNGKLEIVAGSRRYRAAKLAKMRTVPVRIKPMSDQEALEIQIIENLQREDISALDESRAFEALRKQTKLSVQAIAEKTGKSKEYVFARLKLEDLIPDAKKALGKAAIEPGHAILIARLTPENQRRALRAAFDGFSRDGKPLSVAIPVKDLNRWIQVEIYRSVSAAPWPDDDDRLVSKAGACKTCPKLAANMERMPAGANKHTCTDGACWSQKLDAWIERRFQELRKEGRRARLISTRWYHEKKSVLSANSYTKAGRKKCKSLAVGICVDEEFAGKEQEICIGPDCRTHRPQMAGFRMSKKEREEKARRERKQKIEQATRKETLEAIIRAPAPGLADAAKIALMGQLRYGWNYDRTLKLLGLSNHSGASKIWNTISKLSNAQIARALLVSESENVVRNAPYGTSFDALKAAAAAAGVDMKEIRQEAVRRIRSKGPKGRPVKKAAKK